MMSEMADNEFHGVTFFGVFDTSRWRRYSTVLPGIIVWLGLVADSFVEIT
jgi:hypothetical protein